MENKKVIFWMVFWAIIVILLISISAYGIYTGEKKVGERRNEICDKMNMEYLSYANNYVTCYNELIDEIREVRIH